MMKKETNISGKYNKKIITIPITNMIETKAEILNEMKISCQKVYFIMNIKLS